MQHMMFETPFDASSELVQQNEEDASVGVKSAEGGILVNGSDSLGDVDSHLFEESGRLFLCRSLADVQTVDVNEGKLIMRSLLVEEYVSRVIVFGHNAPFVQAGSVADEVFGNQFLLLF